MAVTEKWILVSEGQLYDADSSTSVHVIVDEGAPSGAADPQASANKGTLYFRTDQTDDLSPLYVKIDEDSADDDWVQVMVETSSDAYTMNGALTMGTSTGINLRDSGQKLYSDAADSVAMDLDTSSQFKIGDIGNSNYLTVAYDGELTLIGNAMINQRYRVELFDDFLYQAGFTEADHPWVLNEGSDGSATDPAISRQEGGVIQCVTGAGDGTTAEDASQLVSYVPFQADSGGLVFETRLHINTAITNVSVCAGLTDSSALEEPFSNAADVITSTASDAACFLYDTSATTDEWWALAVDSNTDDAGNATTGTAPTADVYQTLRIEVSSDGATIKYYIDGTLETTLSGDAGVSPDVNLYATVIACGDGTASKSVDVDYIYVGCKR